MQYEKHVFADSSKREIIIWHRSSPMLLNFCVQNLERTIFNDTDCIEVRMGRDHSKNVCIFLAILLFRCKSTSKETCRLELKLDEINEDKDRLENIEEVLKKTSCRFNLMSIDQNRNTHMNIDQFRNVAFSSNENNSLPVANNETRLMIFF